MPALAADAEAKEERILYVEEIEDEAKGEVKEPSLAHPFSFWVRIFITPAERGEIILAHTQDTEKI